MRGTLAVVLNFQDNCPEKLAENGFLDSKLAIDGVRQLQMARNLFLVKPIFGLCQQLGRRFGATVCPEWNSPDDRPKNQLKKAQTWPFLDSKSAIEQAR